MDLQSGLKKALENYIARCTFSLSTPCTNPWAHSQREVLGIEFDVKQIFGITTPQDHTGNEIPAWKKQILQTEEGYKTTLDVLLDSHSMFLKLNNDVAHELDIMVPALLCFPVFVEKENTVIDMTRWSQDRPSKVSNENRLIATQVGGAGDGMRDILHWSPSLGLLKEA